MPGLAALSLFMVSLALPAIRLGVLGHPTDFEGWRAIACSLGFASSLFTDPWGSVSLHQEVGFGVVALSALLNAMFLLPLAWLRRVRAPSRAAIVAWALGTALALVAPDMLGTTDLTRLWGYFAWIAAWGALGVALLAARRASTITS